MEEIALELANDNLGEATRWAMQLQGEEQSAAVSLLVSQWISDDSGAAASFVQSMPAGDTRNQAVADMALNWSQHAPEEAAQWLQHHSGPPQAYRDVVSQWSRFDLESTERWVESLDAGPEADSALSALATSITRESPASAWAWASRIEDPEDREHTYGVIARAWLQQDPELARAEINDTDVSPAARARMLGEDYTPPEPDCPCLLAADVVEFGRAEG
jgi:hypothetical protein